MFEKKVARSCAIDDCGRVLRFAFDGMRFLINLMKGSMESPCIPEAFPVDRSLMRWTTSSALNFTKLGFACER
eukprot:15050991-Ditylum_brightwellii.AAC.1